MRAIDRSKRTLAIESIRAIVGLLAAFSLVWWISRVSEWSRGLGDFWSSRRCSSWPPSALTFTSGLPIHRALESQRREIEQQEERLKAAAARHQFTADLHDALEMSEHEPDIFQIVGRALAHVWDGPGELLLADSSRTHIHEVAGSSTNGSPGCGVGTPWGCPAVRRGQTLEFSHSEALATCPHLAARTEEQSALCVPVTVLGTPTGVIHLTGPTGYSLDDAQRARVETLASKPELGSASFGPWRPASWRRPPMS